MTATRQWAYIETNLARKGIYSLGKSTAPTARRSDLLGEVHTDGELRASDLKALVFLCTRWFHQNHAKTDEAAASQADPPSGDLSRVNFTLAQASQFIYGRRPGGREKQMLDSSMVSIMCCPISMEGYDPVSRQSGIRLIDRAPLITGYSYPEKARDPIAWPVTPRGRSPKSWSFRSGNCDWYALGSDEEHLLKTFASSSDPFSLAQAWKAEDHSVYLSSFLVRMLTARNFTYLDPEILRKLDGSALRLWVYLEADKKVVERGRNQLWLRAPMWETLCLRDLDASSRRRTIEKAAEKILGVDPHYRAIDLRCTPSTGAWALSVERIKHGALSKVDAAGMPARPKPFTPKRGSELIKKLKTGMAIAQACAETGTDIETIGSWIERGESEPGGKYADFVAAIDLTPVGHRERIGDTPPLEAPFDY